ncbi:hypothetical protein AcV5_006867 [Taiwanofungus camphoratus]|nr:hypothetical protein AcV5_006867 [Antrodia cinnamomea]
MFERRNVTRAVALVFSFFGAAYTQATAAAPGQPTRTDAPLGQFEIVGDSIVSAQQMFLGTLDKVYVVDKTERNPTQINGHPAWGSEYSVSTDNGRPMDVITNSFCAGGNVLGNGTWINVGGNQAVTYGGLAAASQTGGPPYDDPDGGQSVRLLDPCDDGSCDWALLKPMTTRRWYPSLETLEDGTLLIIGGCSWGGFVNDATQNNPTWELFPFTGDLITSPMLTKTLPANLYPLTWLLPSGKLLVQANWNTALLDYKAQQETEIDNMIGAVRTYPASAGTAMLPLTPVNNWTATIIFCGGSNLQPEQWVTNWDIAEYQASTSCVTMTPDVSTSYVEDDPLPEPRSMGNLILLPNGKILCFNGAGTGVAGYGNSTWAIGQSYADNPVLAPVIYDPAAPAGQKWSREGLSASTVPRMYHSSATLLPDGAVLVSGSNPNADYNVGTGVTYPTEYRVERFYPSYYNERRPQPQGLPAQLSYGGPYFNVSLSTDDLFGTAANVQNASVVVIRTGFSTHTMNMGQRFVQLESSYTATSNGAAVLHVSQLPPNPAILAPGPALLFVVVNGVPSVGVQVMVGSGQLGAQQTLQAAALPASSMANSTGSGASGAQSGKGGQAHANAASHTLRHAGIRGGVGGWLAIVLGGVYAVVTFC